MINQNQPSLKDPRVIFLSFFATGFSPKAPGTMGSLASLPLLFVLALLLPTLMLQLIFFLIITIAGTYYCHQWIKNQNSQADHDPSWIVIDEVAGMLIAWIIVGGTQEFIDLLLIFVFFRLFDISKIWPVSTFDRMENAIGVMFDDIVAGILAGLLTLLSLKVIAHFII